MIEWNAAQHVEGQKLRGLIALTHIRPFRSSSRIANSFPFKSLSASTYRPTPSPFTHLDADLLDGDSSSFYCNRTVCSVLCAISAIYCFLYKPQSVAYVMRNSMALSSYHWRICRSHQNGGLDPLLSSVHLS